MKKRVAIPWTIGNWGLSESHVEARYKGADLAERLKENPAQALAILKLKDDLDISVAEVLAEHHGLALATILEKMPEKALEILSLRNVFGNPVAHFLAEHCSTALATIVERMPKQAGTILSLSTDRLPSVFHVLAEHSSTDNAALRKVAHVLAEHRGHSLATILEKMPDQALEILKILNSSEEPVAHVLARCNGTALARILEISPPEQARAILKINYSTEKSVFHKIAKDKGTAIVPIIQNWVCQEGRCKTVAFLTHRDPERRSFAEVLYIYDRESYVAIKGSLRESNSVDAAADPNSLKDAISFKYRFSSGASQSPTPAEKYRLFRQSLLDLASHPNTFQNKEDQISLSKAIHNDEFCDDTDVLTALAQNLHVFKEKAALEKVVMAIRDGRFGATQAVLTALVENLHVFADPDFRVSRQGVLDAIVAGCLGDPKAVLARLRVLAQQNVSSGTHFGLILRMLEPHVAAHP